MPSCADKCASHQRRCRAARDRISIGELPAPPECGRCPTGQGSAAQWRLEKPAPADTAVGRPEGDSGSAAATRAPFSRMQRKGSRDCPSPPPPPSRSQRVKREIDGTYSVIKRGRTELIGESLWHKRSRRQARSCPPCAPLKQRALLQQCARGRFAPMPSANKMRHRQ
jgi:hypothetical protein